MNSFSTPRRSSRWALAVALATLGLATGAMAQDARAKPLPLNIAPAVGISGGSFSNANPIMIITSGRGYVVPYLVLNGAGVCAARIDLGNGQTPSNVTFGPANLNQSSEKWGKEIISYSGIQSYTKAGTYTFSVKGIANAPGLGSAPACAGQFVRQIVVELEKK
jgi:hypothetical protein